MTNALDINEFFELIKYFTVFNYYAGGDNLQDPWRITLKTYKK